MRISGKTESGETIQYIRVYRYRDRVFTSGRIEVDGVRMPARPAIRFIKMNFVVAVLIEQLIQDLVLHYF